MPVRLGPRPRRGEVRQDLQDYSGLKTSVSLLLTHISLPYFVSFVWFVGT